MTVDLERAAAAIAELLAAVGEDPRRADLAGTPARVAAAAQELFAGVGRDAADAFRAKGVAEAPVEGPVSVRGVPFRSLCEHHLLPFAGRASVVYLPDERVAGFGDLVGAVEIAAARAQVQERLTDEIADAVDRGLRPRGVLVVLEAEHACLSVRKFRAVGASAVTLAARGVYGSGNARAEALALLRGAGS